VAPFRLARSQSPLSLFEMNQEQAESERDRMAAEHPEATWLVAEQQPGDWAVVRVGIPSGDANRVESTEERPAHTEEAPSTQTRNMPGLNF
jgi:hypothetical protein